MKNLVNEKNIVAITCDGMVRFRNLKLNNKNFYLPYQDSDNLVNLINGKIYGFDFDITKSEIKFYNSLKYYH